MSLPLCACALDVRKAEIKYVRRYFLRVELVIYAYFRFVVNCGGGCYVGQRTRQQRTGDNGREVPVPSCVATSSCSKSFLGGPASIPFLTLAPELQKYFFCKFVYFASDEIEPNFFDQAQLSEASIIKRCEEGSDCCTYGLEGREKGKRPTNNQK